MSSILPFLSDFAIDTDKLPNYDGFIEEFNENIDKKPCDLLMSGEFPEITDIMRSKFKNNVTPHIDANNNLTISHNNRYGLGRIIAIKINPPYVIVNLLNTHYSNIWTGWTLIWLKVIHLFYEC